MEKWGPPQQETAERIIPSFLFLKEVEERSGQPIKRCYQCKKCSGGCPVSFAMDLLPHQVVRFTQWGLEEALLKSASIWVCSGCKTCQARCPNGIDISSINDTLKAMVVEKGLKTECDEIRLFHDTFTDSIERNGRLHELGMMLNYKLKTGKFSQDIKLGFQMFKRGLLKVFPDRVRQKSEIEKIFQKAKGKL